MKDGYTAAHSRLKRQARGDDRDNEYLGTTVKAKKWTDHKYVRSLLRDIHNVAAKFADLWAPHFMASLVHQDNATDYFNALDNGYERSKEANDRSPVWFKGQQIEIDVDGSITEGWRSRKSDGSKFEDL